VTLDHRFGLGIQSDKPPGEYAAIAVQAEELGFGVLSVYGDLMYQPPIGALLEMAAVTEQVMLGPACLNPYSLHPYEIAGQIAFLDMVSQGRAYLGLARGSWLGDVGINQTRPLQRLEEAWFIVAALIEGDDSGFAGEVFTLDPGTRLSYDLARRSVDLLIGSWGPQTLRLAGRLGAAEVKVGGSANPDIAPFVRECLGMAGSETGIVIGAVTVVDDDRVAARHRARREVAMYLDVVAHLDPSFEVEPEVLVRVRHGLAAGDVVAAGAAIPDEVLDRFAFAGTPADVATHASRVLEAGASRVEFGTPHGLTAPRGIDLLGGRVIPAID
jgi:5,10-methylenetetrahydromethanopterin reductase